LTREEIIAWLKEEDESRLDALWQRADNVRKQTVGDEVHLRGLVEFSNYCVRRCAYCGLNVENRELTRYRMSENDILACAHEAVDYGYGTIVLQSGEDYGIKTDWMAKIILRIKSETPLAVTLSLGERPEEDLLAWREAGADRYLLRFETSDHDLYEKIHPSLPGRKSDRFAMLRRLREMGYEIGSGVMIGIPGQSYEMLAQDIRMFSELDLDMIGVGPFIAHPKTRLGHNGAARIPAEEQVPAIEIMTYKVIALSRIVCPEANIPSTTALATLNIHRGRELGLARGANVVMPNITPPEYRIHYEIYPAKACIRETARECHFCMRYRITSIGRKPGVGPGNRIRHTLSRVKSVVMS